MRSFIFILFLTLAACGDPTYHQQQTTTEPTAEKAEDSRCIYPERPREGVAEQVKEIVEESIKNLDGKGGENEDRKELQQR